MDSSFLIPIAVLAIILIVAFLAYRGITNAASHAGGIPWCVRAASVGG